TLTLHTNMLPFRMLRLATLLVLVCLLPFHSALIAQTSGPLQEQGDVLRVYTQLVQTDVMVFDRQGKFVPGLTKEDFELRIDGKPRPIDFFEKITAGSVNEESQLAAARGSSVRPNNTKAPASIPLDRGRPVFFYIDDLHMDLTGMKMTRELITRFIDKEMGQNDEAAVSSASGQIGFLQQLTHDKAVLRAALKRLNVRQFSVRDFESPPMTEYQAMLVENYDRDLTEYFIDEVIRKNPGTTRDTAEAMVRGRARSLMAQSGNITRNTLIGLEGLVRSAKEIPGRKLVFFISGGFFLGERGSDTMDRLRKITSAAARSGVVIYSMDARGLVASLRDASTESQFDLSGRLQRAEGGELSASQDALNALAKDTGGKAVFNTNSLGTGLSKALKETSVYYLLAWKPEPESQHANKFRRIEVKVIGKPELTVQVRRGFFDVEPEAPVARKPKEKKTNAAAPVEKSSVTELRKVIFDTFPNRDLPVSLSLNFVNTPARGPMLTAFMQVPNEFLSFVPANGRQTAVVDVAGTVLNDKGGVGATFGSRLTVDGAAIQAASYKQDPGYGYALYLTPGLYQVRVGARDERTGRSGSAHAWIEIPDLASGKLALSSLVIGGRPAAAINPASSTPQIPDAAATELRIAHRFLTTDFLRFMLFVYNGSRATADSKPDIALQVQVVRDDQPVVTSPLRKVSVEGVEDLTRIPFAAEIPLNGLQPGRYVLQITAVDRVSKQSSTQQTRFEIE
ncbi:MAG TPA: VWA domain-containing protein, partial [Pyrinomonadaceae bacterium]|nr:VWA domain-containing protein [Pyrinomonadaceae bacterium]